MILEFIITNIGRVAPFDEVWRHDGEQADGTVQPPKHRCSDRGRDAQAALPGTAPFSPSYHALGYQTEADVYGAFVPLIRPRLWPIMNNHIDVGS